MSGPPWHHHPSESALQTTINTHCETNGKKPPSSKRVRFLVFEEGGFLSLVSGRIGQGRDRDLVEMVPAADLALLGQVVQPSVEHLRPLTPHPLGSALTPSLSALIPSPSALTPSSSALTHVAHGGVISAQHVPKALGCTQAQG